MQRFLSFLLRRVIQQILYNMRPKLLKLQNTAAAPAAPPPTQKKTNKHSVDVFVVTRHSG